MKFSLKQYEKWLETPLKWLGMSPGEWCKHMLKDDTPMDLICLIAWREMTDVSPKLNLKF